MDPDIDNLHKKVQAQRECFEEILKKEMLNPQRSSPEAVKNAQVMVQEAEALEKKIYNVKRKLSFGDDQ